MAGGHISAPLQQEDLWHLPGRLRINPSLWDKDDVFHWLHWAQREYSLQRPEKGRFEMNGRALCLLTKEDFRRRCPNSGDVLYEILQCVKQHRRGPVLVPQTSSPILTNAQNHSPVRTDWTPTHNLQEPQSAILSRTKDVSTPSPSPQSESLTQQPLNLSSRERSRSPLQRVNGRIPDCRLLCDYIYQLLSDHRYQDYIRWEDHDSMVFRVVDPNGLARLWGNHKNRENMTYEKMSRALRHYYKLNILKKEQRQKLLFRFLKLPRDLKKVQVDVSESPGHSSPSPDPSVSQGSPSELEFSREHFQVSPDRASPSSPLGGAPLR